jgi:hypothetical protein
MIQRELAICSPDLPQRRRIQERVNHAVSLRKLDQHFKRRSHRPLIVWQAFLGDRSSDGDKRVSARNGVFDQRKSGLSPLNFRAGGRLHCYFVEY